MYSFGKPVRFPEWSKCSESQGEQMLQLFLVRKNMIEELRLWIEYTSFQVVISIELKLTDLRYKINNNPRRAHKSSYFKSNQFLGLDLVDVFSEIT